MKVTSKVGPQQTEDNVLTNDCSEMAKIVSRQYLKVFGNTTPSRKEEIYKNLCESEDMNALDNFSFTQDDIVAAIDELSNASSAGPDNFPSMLLKICKTIIAKPLKMIWQSSFDKAIVEMLKKSIITPIYKGGNRAEASNYRPIALKSHIIKIFRKILRYNDKTLARKSTFQCYQEDILA